MESQTKSCYGQISIISRNPIIGVAPSSGCPGHFLAFPHRKTLAPLGIASPWAKWSAAGRGTPQWPALPRRLPRRFRAAVTGHTARRRPRGAPCATPNDVKNGTAGGKGGEKKSWENGSPQLFDVDLVCLLSPHEQCSSICLPKDIIYLSYPLEPHPVGFWSTIPGIR